MRKYYRWIAYCLILFIPVVLGSIDVFQFSDEGKKWVTGIGIVVFLIALGYDIWDKVVLKKNEDLNVKENKELKREIEKLEKILNKSFDIFKEKRRVLINEITEPKYKKEDVIHYSVHEHMRYIMAELKDCICDITGIDPKNLSVHFMYKHTNDSSEDWKWIDGNNVSVSHTLNRIINNENSCYYRVLHTDDKFVFENDKIKAISEEKYISSDRDKYYNKKGSIVCAKIDCGRYGKSYIEGIVSISSYGRKFVESDNIEEINKLKNSMKYQILAYYNALLEIEMASLSLRHSVQARNEGKKSCAFFKKK